GGRDVCARVAVRALAQRVEIGQRLRLGAATATQIGLDVDQLRVSESEDREIRIDHARLRTIGSARRLVGELRRGNPVAELPDGIGVDLLSGLEEERGAPVADTEQ